MQESEPSWKRAELVFLLLVVAAGLALTAPLGILGDEYVQAVAARNASWFQVLTGQSGPLTFHMILWKACVVLLPSEPSTLMRFIGICIHGANLWLLGKVIGRHFRPPVALCILLFVAVHRSGNEALMWGAATVETQVLFFTLLALWCWQRRLAAPRGAWIALLPALAAVLAKPTGVMVPPILFLHWLLLEEKSGKNRSGALVPLAAMSMLSAAVFLHSYYNPGFYQSHVNRIDVAYELRWYFDYFIQTVGGLFFSLYPVPLDICFLLGTLALFFGIPLLWIADRRIRFAAGWIVCFAVPPIIAAGWTQPRYGYIPLVGAGIIYGVFAEKLEDRRRAFQLVVWLPWLLVNLWFYRLDYRGYHAFGRVGLGLRDNYLLHGPELEAAGTLYVNYPVFPLPPSPDTRSKIDEYFLGKPLKVRWVHEKTCPSGLPAPCIDAPGTFKAAIECAERDPDTCLKWNPASPAP